MKKQFKLNVTIKANNKLKQITPLQGYNTKTGLKACAKRVVGQYGKGYAQLQNNYCSPRWSYLIKESKMPLSFDSYSHCAFNCKYCLAYYQKALKSCNPLFPGENTNYRKMKPRSINLASFDRLMHLEKKSQFYDYVKAGLPLQWGGLADPFCYFEDKYRVGLEILKILDDVKYPTSFSTKGVNFTLDEEYMELFKQNPNWRMQWSIINLDKARAAEVEQAVPSPTIRLGAMQRFIEYTGRSATLRLRPFIIGLSDIDDEYLDLIAEAAKIGSKRVSMEFFCLESRMSPGVKKRYDDLSESVGFDIVDFYRKNSPSMSGYLRLNWKLKARYVEKMLKVCKQFGMAFYSSDSMTKDMSRSFGNPSEFQKEFTGNYSQAMLKGMKRENKECYWIDVLPGIKEAGLHKFNWRHAEGYNTVGNQTRARRWLQTMEEFLHECWNAPNDHKSPYHHFFGVMVPCRVDKDGDVVYKYTPRKGIRYID